MKRNILVVGCVSALMCPALLLAACGQRNTDGTANLDDADIGCRHGVQYFNVGGKGWTEDRDKDGNLLGCGSSQDASVTTTTDSDSDSGAQPDSSADDLNSSAADTQ